MLSAAVLAFGQTAGIVSENTRYWVEKSPYNEFYTRQIYEWWPQARCIHVLRDPRDNFASYRRKHPDWTAEFFAANWKRSTNAGVENLEKFGTERYLLLRYEDLVQDPQETLQAIVKFLDLDWDESLASPTRAGEQWRGNSMFADRFSGISSAAVGRWQTNLDPADAAVIEILDRELLEIWQYNERAVLNLSQRTAALWRAFTWPVRKRLGGRLKSANSKPNPG
jgi:hypothetical protein